MRGAVCESVGGPVAIVDDIEVEQPRAGEVLIRVAHCGLCHSDITVKNFEGGRPILLGHEASGHVEAIGAGVTHLHPGDAVVMTVAPACGRYFFCSRGQTGICEQSINALSGLLPAGGTGFHRNGIPVYRSVGVGAFTERIVMPASAVVRIPEDTPLAEAALLGCGIGTGLGAVFNTAKVRPGESVVVFGLGGVGVAAVQAARITGASPIVGVDPVAERRKSAQQFGATEVLDPDSDDVVHAVFEMTRLGADHAIDAVGHPGVFASALASIRNGGTVTLVGAPTPGVAYRIDDAVYAILGEKHIQGCAYGSSHPQRDIPRYLSLRRAGLLDLTGMISSRLPLDHIGEAFGNLEKGVGLRTVIDL